MPSPPGLGTRFWTLWSASTLSNFADGVYRVVLPLLAVQYTRSPLLVSLVAALAYLPLLLFALHAGALADRRDRRRILVGANGARVAALLGFATAVVLGLDSLWLLCALALVVGTAETFFDSTAQSVLPMLVRRDQLSRANGRLFAAREVMESFAGRAGGGLLLALATTAAIATPAALYAAAVGALLAIRGRYRPHRPEETTIRQDIRQGVRYLAGHPLLRSLALMTGLVNLSLTAFMAVFVLYAVGPDSAMGLPESAYGLLLTATAAGSVVGALLTERIQRWTGRARLLAGTVLMNALSAAVPAFTANVAVVAAGFVSVGMGILMWNVTVVSLRQRIIPEHLLGRVNSCYRLLAWGTMPIGALLGGLVAEVVGLRGLFLLVALAIAAVLVLHRNVTERAIADAEGQHH